MYIFGVAPLFFPLDLQNLYHRTWFVLFHSVFLSANSVMLCLAGSLRGTVKSDKGHLLRVFTSFLALISLMSIAISMILSGTIIESAYKRPILFCGYGFLAISSYSLGRVGAILKKHLEVKALCFALSGLFGFFFGTMISLVSPLTPYFTFSFSVQLQIILRLFVANNYVQELECILRD